MEVPSRETIEKGSQNEEHDRPEVATHEKIPTNIMCNLAEKAMSIAGPVVPMKDDGEVDQERWVRLHYSHFFLSFGFFSLVDVTLHLSLLNM